MNHYEEQGIVSVLPGLELVLQCLGAEVDRMLELVSEEKQPALHITRAVVTNGSSSNRRNKRSTAVKRAWQKKTAKQKRAWIAAIQRGKKAKAKQTETRTE